jgi:hypothetical protein
LEIGNASRAGRRSRCRGRNGLHKPRPEATALAFPGSDSICLVSNNDQAKRNMLRTAHVCAIFVLQRMPRYVNDDDPRRNKSTVASCMHAPGTVRQVDSVHFSKNRIAFCQTWSSLGTLGLLGVYLGEAQAWMYISKPRRHPVSISLRQGLVEHHPHNDMGQLDPSKTGRARAWIGDCVGIPLFVMPLLLPQSLM